MPNQLSAHDYDLLYNALAETLEDDGSRGMDLPRTIRALEAIDLLHGRAALIALLTGRSPRATD